MPRKKIKKNSLLNKNLHHLVSWCTLCLFVTICFTAMGNAAAALAQEENNFQRQVFRQQIPHLSGKFSSSTANFIRRGQMMPCRQNGSSTACSLATEQRPGSLSNFSNTSRPQISESQLKLMKKNSSQFKKMLSSLNSQASSLQKQNINLPADLTQALTDLSSYLSQIKNASSTTSIQGLSDGLTSAIQNIQQWTPKISQLAQLPIIIKQAQNQINQAEKNYAADQKRATSSEFDLTVPLADYNAIINQMQNAITQTKADMQNNPAAATSTLQNGFFAKQSILQINKLILDIALTPRSGLSEADQIISQDQKKIKSLQKSGVDTTQLVAQLAQAKTQAAQVKISLASSSISTADTLSSIENLAGILQNIGLTLPVPNAFAPTKSDSGFQPPAGFVMNTDQPQNGPMKPVSGNSQPEQDPPPLQSTPSGSPVNAPDSATVPPPAIIQ